MQSFLKFICNLKGLIWKNVHRIISFSIARNKFWLLFVYRRITGDPRSGNSSKKITIVPTNTLYFDIKSKKHFVQCFRNPVMDSQYALYVTKSLVTQDIKLLGAKKTTYFKVLFKKFVLKTLLTRASPVTQKLSQEWKMLKA